MRKLIFILLVIVFFWLLWIRAGRERSDATPDMALDHSEEIKLTDYCESNVVAIQPYMYTQDYITGKAFYDKMDAYFAQAKHLGYFSENTVVLLPEYLGTWLVTRGEKNSVAEAESIEGAMFIMVMSRPRKFFINLFKGDADEGDPFTGAIFRMKAESMAKTYAETFTSLAKKYGVGISAGSIVLPGPFVEDNEIKVKPEQALYNSSFVFHANGEIDTKVVKKSYPINAELPFISSYPIEELPSFNLPIGKTAILICADSWYPDSYQRIRAMNVEVILVNSYLTGDGTMQRDWYGYDGANEPDDYDYNDIYNITEQEAWIKYALPGRIQKSRARVGVNVFLRGQLWNMGSDGQPFFIGNGELLEAGISHRAGIWNYCF